jgi:hypothetical protein
VGVVLVVEVVLAGLLIGSRGSAPVASAPAPTQSPPGHDTLVVGDGRTVRLLSLGGQRTDALLSRVAADIGGAVAKVEAFWGTDWSHEIVVVAAGSDQEFSADAGLAPGGQWADIAAVTVADQVDPARRLAVGQRIVFAPGASAMSETALGVVLTHELFHFAARADTALDAPRWLTEGVADYVARPPTPIPASAASQTALPSDAELDTPGPQRSLGYDRAWWFARFVADTYGPDRLRALYLRACGVGHTDLASAAQQVLGTDLAELRARWAQWLRS